MWDSLFSTLFKYRPSVFAEGRLVFETPRPAFVVLAVATLAVVLAVFYLRRRPRPEGRRFAVLVGLRTLALAALAVVLVRPALRVSTAVEGENFLAVLVDDSRSMALPAEEDAEAVSRGERALELFGVAQDSDLLRELAERFTLRTYRFSDAPTRLDPAAPPTFDGRFTDLAAALEGVRQDLDGVPLGGIVVASDGADNVPAAIAASSVTRSGVARSGSSRALSRLDGTLLQLASRGVPVYTVGFGAERFERDLEISSLRGPERVLAGSAFAVDVTLEQHGFAGDTATLDIERDGVLVESRELRFETSSGRDAPGVETVRVQLEAAASGTSRYTFRVEPTADTAAEAVTQNNVRELLVTVEARRERILYVEGEPRHEVKFLRQAVAEDANLELVVLLRTAGSKMARFGTEDPFELVSGFPTTREELFAYRAVVLGSVEAAFFTAQQMRLLEEYVGERGGAVLFLGGTRAFAAGGYTGTPLEAVLPVVFEAEDRGGGRGAGALQGLRVRPTTAGLAHPALQLASEASASRGRWHSLPTLTTRHALRRVKPGASVLLSGDPVDPETPAPVGPIPEGVEELLTDNFPAGDGERSEALVVLAEQRYGKGRAMAWNVQDTWLWQMLPDVADTTHEQLWRQLLRSLVRAVPSRLELGLSDRLPEPGEPMELRAAVRDAAFMGLNNARVTTWVVDPLGVESAVPLEWTVDEDGDYRATFVPEMVGAYDVRLVAELEDETLEEVTSRWVAVEASEESFGATLNVPLLRRLAADTGGRFYTADDVDNLAEDARYTRSGKTVVENLPLWDMPALLLVVLGALGAEWMLRRRLGLV